MRKRSSSRGGGSSGARNSMAQMITWPGPTPGAERRGLFRHSRLEKDDLSIGEYEFFRREQDDGVRRGGGWIGLHHRTEIPVACDVPAPMRGPRLRGQHAPGAVLAINVVVGR